MSFNPNYLTNYNLNTTHPLQNNANQYETITKYVSIHSEDRNMTKYPSSSYFEIQLPQSLENVTAVRVNDWGFPSNYNTFSSSFRNVELTFKIIAPFKPNEILYPTEYAIYIALTALQTTNMLVVISPGFYNPQQMVTELTNKLNFVVQTEINNYYGTPIYTYTYNRFSVVYNEVEQNIWFGNTSDQFDLTNSVPAAQTKLQTNLDCDETTHSVRHDEYNNYGLPSFIGLPKTDMISINGDGTTIDTPRFFYGDVNSGDNGFWLLPDTDIGATKVWWIRSPNKINLMGPAYIYIEVNGMNCMDEMYPFTSNEYNSTNSNQSGIANSALAKIAVSSTPVSQWFNNNYQQSYNYFFPPAENIRKLRIKIRYHNGIVPDFGAFPWSITMEFILLKPQILRQGTLVTGQTNLISKK
jgi:hypothetical protein